MGILALVDGFITPRPRRGAVRCPPVWATPLIELPPRSGIGVGLGIPMDGAGAKTGAGAGPVGAGGLGAAGFGIGAGADAAAGPGAGLGAGAGAEIGAGASLEGAPGAGPVFWPGGTTHLKPTFEDGTFGTGLGATTDLKPLMGFEAAGLAADCFGGATFGGAGCLADSCGVGAHMLTAGIGSVIGTGLGGSILPFPGEAGMLHAGGAV